MCELEVFVKYGLFSTAGPGRGHLCNHLGHWSTLITAASESFDLICTVLRSMHGGTHDALVAPAVRR